MPSWRAMNTVAATSSVMTAALTAALAVGPIVNTPWFLSRIAGEVADALHHQPPDPLVADEREARARDLAAELVGLRGEVDRDRPAHGRERRRVARVGVHDAVHVRPVAVDVEVARRVRAGRVARPRRPLPSGSTTTIVSAVRSS